MKRKKNMPRCISPSRHKERRKSGWNILHFQTDSKCRFSDYYGAWRALEDLYDEGKLRAIGVSNFYPDRLVDIASFSRIRPMVNQVETHPHNQQTEAKKWMEKYGIQHEAGHRSAKAGTACLKIRFFRRSVKNMEKPRHRSFSAGISREIRS